MNKQRLLYCLLLSLVMIPVMIFSSVGFVHTYQSYNSDVIEKEYTYIGCDNPTSKYGLYLKVADKTGNEKEIVLSTNEFSSQWDFLDEVQAGEKICVSFSVSDTDENYIVGLRTESRVYYGEALNRKEDVAMMILYAVFALASFFIEIAFILASKKIFRKQERIIKRTDRPATEDMFKESFFE